NYKAFHLIVNQNFSYKPRKIRPTVIYLPVRSITAKAAKNRTIPPSSKTVNPQNRKKFHKT
ncbi:hypothetical protein, partial [Neisseria sp. GT4A_CT1]|uniref:hypothetical protein n=1 Tax=Neisseria sp. GT4A_CT1 TaxID=665946 RepID=UPI001E4D916C